MPDTPYDTAWLTEHHQYAQQAAVRWANEAETTATTATDREDWAKDSADSSYLHDAVTDARQEATTLRSRSAEASRLAEMWARVATVLAPGTSGQPAAYDLTVQVDAKAIARELAHAQDARRTTPSPKTG